MTRSVGGVLVPGEELRGRLRELAAVYRMAETAVAEGDVAAILTMGM